MTKKKENDDFLANSPSSMFATTKAYIVGSKVQLERYLEAQNVLEAHRTIFSGLDKATYELSSLLEHLDSIEVQLERRNIKLPTGEKIRQFRNHLRHDARGDGDFSNGKRGKAIELNDNLLVQIEPISGGIKMGEVVLTARDIDLYIVMAETIMWTLYLGGDIEIDGDTVTVIHRKSVITVKSNSEGEKK